MPSLLDNLQDLFTLLSFDAIRASATYRWRKAAAEARWTSNGQRRRGPEQWLTLIKRGLQPQRTWPKRWRTFGAITLIEPTERGGRLRSAEGTIEITFVASDLVRVRYIPQDTGSAGAADVEPPSYAIYRPIAAWPTPPFVCIQEPQACLFQSEHLVVGVALATGQLFFATPGGQLLRSDIEAARAENGAWRHRVALSPEERIYGLGERATAYDRRGRTHVLWNTDPSGYRNDDDPINLNIPVAVHALPTDDNKGALSSLVFYDNPTYAEFDLGQSVPEIADHRFAGGELRYYFGAGPLPQLLERYTELTGRHTMQPLWMLGYQQSRWSYDSEARVRKLAADFREHQVPCDVIHLDIDYMDGFRCFTWNRAAFPNPTQMAADLREAGIKLISIIDPAIKRDPDYAVYREGVKGDHFCTTPDGRIFHAPVWPGNSGFPDFTDPQTRAWWGQLYRPLLEDGIAGFWNDMNEPAAFGQGCDRTLPDTVQHAMDGLGGTHADAHNVYGMLMVRATREGLAAIQPDRRPIAITRAGWAGVQRYATSWTGDNESTWDSLKLTIPMMLGLGVSGLGFSGPDVGGFADAADGELFTRWIQMAAFMPFFRAHTVKGSPDQEPWSYGEPYLSIVRRFIELRYELLPYLYTAMWVMCERGWPMVRPLAWAAPQAAILWDVDDAFLCGDKLLIAPMLAPGAAEREVVLPPGTWYDFWTNRQHHTDGDVATVIQLAPLEIMPLFVQGGTVLTLGESGPSVEQRKDKFLRLNVYPLAGAGEATTELYEDAGTGLAYQRGERRLSQFQLYQTEDAIKIRWEKVGAYTPPYEHIALTICGLKRVPKEVRADGEAYAILQADPVQHSAILGVPIFEELEILL